MIMSLWSFTIQELLTLTCLDTLYPGRYPRFCRWNNAAAGGYLVVCIDASFYASVVNDGTDGGAVVDTVSWTSGGISNGGEDIEIVDSLGNVVDLLITRTAQTTMVTGAQAMMAADHHSSLLILAQIIA